MDKFNLNFSSKENTIKSIFWICSVISWILFVLTSWMSINTIKYEYILFTIGRMTFWTSNLPDGTQIQDGKVYPLELYEDFIYIIDFILIIIGTIAFIIYMVKSTCKKDGLYEKMSDQWTRFHFIPILLLAFLYIIGETKTSENWGAREKPAHIMGLIIDLLALPSMIFIYLKTEARGGWFDASIKKGVYSSIIAMEWYYLFYDITYFPYNNCDGLPIKVVKGYGIAWAIIVGVGLLCFALFFRDAVVSFYCFIMYLGMAVYYFNIHSSTRSNYNGALDGIIDIIMIILSILLTLFLIIKYKMDLLK